MKLRIAFAFGLALLVPALAAPQSVTPEDWYLIDRLSDVQFSPDGKWIAFVVTRADREKQRNISHIWTVAADGLTGPGPFTSGAQGENHPRWSPDSSRLAFLSSSDGNGPRQIYVMAAGGGAAKKLTTLPFGVSSFVWSPDGRCQAAVARTGRSPAKDDPLGGVIAVRSAKYDLDGRGFLRDQRSHIFVVDSDSGETKQITDGDFDDSHPAWSPDGGLVAFVSDRTGKAWEGSRNTDIFLVPSTGGNPRRISLHREANGFPAFSPDGATIAYTGVEYEEDQPDIWTSPLDGGIPVNVTQGFDEAVSQFIWTAKGMFFSADFKGERPVFKVDPSSKSIETADGKGFVVDSFSISNAGEIALIKSGFMHPGEVYIGLRRITDFNRTFVYGHSMVQAEEIWYKMQDDRDIQGWLVKPLDFDPTRKYPMILRIHGGPASMFGVGFEHEVQVLAGRGYAVLSINPRGSTGYGQEFVRLNRKDWGGGDYWDLMRGVDIVLNRNDWIDTNRLFVYGGSYGGFMTNWIITQTTRFRAAVAERSISNWVNFWGTIDLPYWLEDEFGSSPWEGFDLWWDRSPLKHAMKVKTPTLFINGESDDRTPPEQAEQMFRALRRFGVEAEMVRYPGESHGRFNNGKPAHYVDRIDRIVGWFEKH